MDNLFIVESPLQALIAVELGLQFAGKKNGIIYRLSGAERYRNNEQIEKVVRRGNWNYVESVVFNNSGKLAYHLSIRSFLKKLKYNFSVKVGQLFIGEFRSQWMHFSRSVIEPNKAILIDDGAATLTLKKKFIDNFIYYPKELWASDNKVKIFFKKAMYFGLVNKNILDEPFFFASAFLKNDSLYPIDFSSIRSQLLKSEALDVKENKAYYFGSKYSEAGVVSRDYELRFISQIKRFYENRGLILIYCAHRDESEEKLSAIRDLVGAHVVIPDMPAEVFMIDNHQSAQEISAAYSSVLNNFQLIFPEKFIRSFMLDVDEIAVKNKENISYIYQCLESSGIFIEKDFLD